MPHKHRRKGVQVQDFNLPPSQIARPLPVTPGTKAPNPPPGTKPRKKKKGKPSNDWDDAPRAFKRIMALSKGIRPRPGLDDGPSEVQQRRREEANSDKAATIPTILPGEGMASFAARVDATIPISASDTRTIKSGKDPLGLPTKRTWKERKMHKLYDQWREEDRKIKEAREERLENDAELELDSELFMLTSESATQGGMRPGGKRKRRGEQDPWEELKRSRREAEKKQSKADDAPQPAVLDLSKLKKFSGGMIPSS